MFEFGSTLSAIDPSVRPGSPLPRAPRALALKPSVLLMDEPFAALDAMTKAILQDELLRVRQQTGASIVFITRDAPHGRSDAARPGHRGRARPVARRAARLLSDRARLRLTSAELLRPVPAVALVPVAMLMFGFSIQTELLVIVIPSIWPVLHEHGHGLTALQRPKLPCRVPQGRSSQERCSSLFLCTATALLRAAAEHVCHHSFSADSPMREPSRPFWTMW